MVRRSSRLPSRHWKAPKYLAELALDLADTLRGEHRPLVPPRRLRWYVDGGPGFTLEGERFARFLVEEAGLEPTDRILDVGCGIGRMAIPLARYLRPPGAYEGFDIVPAGIAWCRRHISARYPNFRFRHADIHNSRYNPGGRQRASDFRFPYLDGWFDTALAASVFTHLLPEAVDRYLSEVSRVLKPGGRSVLTFFLIDPQAEAAIAAGRSAFGFRRRGALWSIDESTPERALAYEREHIERLHHSAGLYVRRVLPGAWRGDHREWPGQDLVVAEKTPFTTTYKDTRENAEC